MSKKLAELQNVVAKAGLDAWVLYDFRGSNPLAWQILRLDSDAHCTRRWMVIIPAKGVPIKIVHSMEQEPLEHLNITTRTYNTRTSWHEVVKDTLAPYTTIAMEYSPMNELPVISKVDAGTVEMLRSLGKDVVSSADIVQEFTAVLSEEQLAGAAVTGGLLRDIVFDAFEFVRNEMLGGATVNEYQVQQYIVERFSKAGLVTDGSPIVAIGANASSPHYAPTATRYSTIPAETTLLIDAWCKSSAPGAAYADITWVGYTGVAVPEDVSRTFSIIVNARNAALTIVNERFRSGKPVSGYEVDRACRDVVQQAGMSDSFFHRTGHNITTEVHGPGANMDDYETHDTRTILPGTMFSIEPGIYLEGLLGLRTEIDVIVQTDGTISVPSSPMQTEIMAILSDDWKQ